MKKRDNFIGRLLRRNNDDACDDINKEGVDDQVKDGKVDPGAGSKPESNTESDPGPTLCRNGKLYKARLRNGRWETIGAPIGEC